MCVSVKLIAGLCPLRTILEQYNAKNKFQAMASRDPNSTHRGSENIYTLGPYTRIPLRQAASFLFHKYFPLFSSLAFCLCLLLMLLPFSLGMASSWHSNLTCNVTFWEASSLTVLLASLLTPSYFISFLLLLRVYNYLFIFHLIVVLPH